MTAPDEFDVIVVGSGNAAMCAAIAALDGCSTVLVLEKADLELAGGNSRYTAGAMRFAYDDSADLLPLLDNPSDSRIERSDFGSYSRAQFASDLHGFNLGQDLSVEQRALVDESLPTMRWLADHGVRFEPIYDRQSFERDGIQVFWGGLTLAATGEGTGLVDRELDVVEELGGELRCSSAVADLIVDGASVCGVVLESGARLLAKSVVLACGGFEASAEKRVEHLGADWAQAKVRGTPHNTGIGLDLAFALGAKRHGVYEHCHATPMDFHMANFGNLDLPHLERKNYRKICYFLGIMLNARGVRFVDEGMDFRNYTYAQFGRAVLEQPGHIAWQLFDNKVADLLYEEYRFHDASFVQSDSLEGLIDQLAGIDRSQARATIDAYNQAVEVDVPFDPSVKDGKGTQGIQPPKSNWAQTLDTPPFRAFPVTGGITFTYGGLEVDASGAVMRTDGSAIDGLFACGELVGGVFVGGYPGGSGLTSGAVFGRRAGDGAARYSRTRIQT